MRAPDHHFQDDHGLEAQPFLLPIGLVLVIGFINVAAAVFSRLEVDGLPYSRGKYAMGILCPVGD
jgi:hypothetical protein